MTPLTTTDDHTVTKETFDKLLDQLINNNSVKVNTAGNREWLSLPTKSNKKNQQSHIEDPWGVENCFINSKPVITDEFESLRKSFLQEVITFKNELSQTSLAKKSENQSFGKPDSLFPEGTERKKSARKFITRLTIQM